MTEAVQAQHIMLATMAGASVVLFGAFYALFYALAKLQKRRMLFWLAYGSYSAFFIATVVLAETLNLNGVWFWLVVILLAGYLLAPQGIWYLCVGTHEHEGVDEQSGSPNEGGI